MSPWLQLVLQGRIQDSLHGAQIYKGGFDLLILPDYLLTFPDFLKILHGNEINLSQREVRASHMSFQ